jgi:hypothetical protein
VSCSSSTHHSLSRNLDDYIQELQDDKHTALWHVILSNGEHVIMDDGRPNVEPNSAWIRLSRYIAETSLSISKLWLQFRSNRTDELPADKEGYFFCKNLIGTMEGVKKFNYFIGYLEDGNVHLQRWSNPELIFVDTETRTLGRVTEQSVDCLIRNPKWTTGTTNSISTI